jgi:hypothetical protein
VSHTKIACLSTVAALALIAAVGTSTAATATSCTSFGTRWAASYNKTAAKDRNPVRVVTACCGGANASGVHHCAITVTLVGTKDRGCESVGIGKSGVPVGPGTHETCPPQRKA